MENQSQDFDRVLMSFDEIWHLITSFAVSILNPGWRQNQIIILFALMVVAWVLHRLLGREIDRRVRAREGWEKWKLRFIVQPSMATLRPAGC